MCQTLVILLQGQYLDINKPITALAAGELDPKSGRDHLFIGTPTNLQAYDVEQNKGLFFKEVRKTFALPVFRAEMLSRCQIDRIL